MKLNSINSNAHSAKINNVSVVLFSSQLSLPIEFCYYRPSIGRLIYSIALIILYIRVLGN